MKVLVPMVDADLARHRNDPWYILHAAMIHTRAGDPKKAMEILQSTPANSWNYPANAPMLALIYQALGQIDLSRTALEQGRKNQSDELRARLDDTSKPPIIEWVDDVVLRELFVREVSTKLDGKPAADNPYVLLLRQRSLERMGRESEAAKISSIVGPRGPMIHRSPCLKPASSRSSPSQRATARPNHGIRVAGKGDGLTA